MSDTVLSTEALTVKIGRRAILDRISIAFRAGETAVIAGANGGGKSTLLRCLAGVVVPDKGRIVRGHGIAPERIGFLSDALSLYEGWTIGEAWRFHRRVFKIEASDPPPFDGLDLDPRRTIRGLSVGERTMVQLRNVLAQKPKVLLLDEIIHALDPYLRDKFLAAVIESMDAFGTAVIMINHTFSDTAHLPERVLILDEGKFILDEKREELPGRIKKLVLDGPAPAGFPVLFQADSPLGREYYVYPFRPEMAGGRAPAFQDLGLGEIVKAFIGGAYVQKRAR